MNFDKVLTEYNTDESHTKYKEFHNKKILVAVNGKKYQKLFKTSLTELGSIVMIAEHGQDVLEIICMHHLDLIILDSKLSLCSGFQVLRKVKKDEEFKKYSSIIVFMLVSRKEEYEQARKLNTYSIYKFFDFNYYFVHIQQFFLSSDYFRKQRELNAFYLKKQQHITFPGLAAFEDELNRLIFDKDWGIFSFRIKKDVDATIFTFLIAHLNAGYVGQLSSDSYVIIAEKQRIHNLKNMLTKWFRNWSKITSQVKILWADRVGAFTSTAAILKKLHIKNTHKNVNEISKEHSNKKRILIVDDEKILRNLIARFLKKEGYEPIEAWDGKSALELVQICKPDLILTDIRMPGMDGIRLLAKLKKDNEYMKYSKIPIILMTGYGDEETMLESIELGCLFFFKKAFNFKQLSDIIGVSIETAELKKKNIEIVIHGENKGVTIHLQLNSANHLREHLSRLIFSSGWGIMLIRILKKSYSMFILSLLSCLDGKCIGQTGENEYIIIDTKEKIIQLEETVKDWIIDISHLSLCIGTVFSDRVGMYMDTDSIINTARDRLKEGMV